MSITSITPKGQIVIPREILRILGLKPGCLLNIQLQGDCLMLEPASEDQLQEAHSEEWAVDG